MSKITKRKHVTREVLEEYVLPEQNQEIVKILGGRGNNLHEVETSSGDLYLASMPPKFRKSVWIKRGDFVIVEPIAEGSKVKAEIVIILYPQQIKHIKQEGMWPEKFAEKDLSMQNDVQLQTKADEGVAKDLEKLSLDSNKKEEHSDGKEDSASESDNDDDLFVNTNRPMVTYYTDDSDEDTEEEDEQDEQSR